MKSIVTIVAILMLSVTASAQFSGDYYIGALGTGPGGTDPNYQTLKDACDAVNGSSVTGAVTFYITSDLTEPANVNLGINTAGNTITFKPLDDLSTRTITFTQAADNSGPSGGFVIGITNINDWTTLLTTDNVVIDGYATGGSTRRLTWKSGAAAHYLTGPICVAGNSNNITIKNNTVVHEGVASAANNNVYGIAVRVRNASSVNYVPDNITIENNDVTITTVNAGNGIGVTNSGTPTATATGIVIKDNTILARHRGVFMSYCASYVVSGNTISVNQTTAGYASAGIAGNTGNSGVHEVFKNKFLQLATATTAGGAFGIRAIQCSGGGTYNVYNNFITGFSTPTGGAAEVVGIRVGVGTNMYYNTIVMNNVATAGAGTTPTAGIVLYTATADIRNNIIITEEDDFASYTIYASSMPNTSDYNLLYRTGTTNAKIGFASSAAQATLGDWQTTTSKDANSHSAAVSFVDKNNGDLHLDVSAIDPNLIGTPLAGYTVDFDNQTRNSTFPYVGADENLTYTLPVELTSFTAVMKSGRVELQWSTATETNNKGFEVQRAVAGEWSALGFVNGAGTSNAPKQYSYVDASAKGTVQYRLKQVDNDGSITYSSVVEITVAAVAERYELAQNYPNPFNPTTTIRFAVKNTEQTRVTVYDIAGREVAVLFNDVAQAGQQYSVPFNGTGLSSGIYFYVLQTPGAREVRKMQLLK